VIEGIAREHPGERVELWFMDEAKIGQKRRLIPTALVGDRFGPLAAGDRGEPVGRRHEPVPRLAAGRDDGLVVRPDPQAELVLAQVLPDVLDRVQTLWGGRRG
jgi:hypothetical protein